ncbi:MAG: TonB-dependent receptor [Cyclobacteriaceae bacterium]|nr:TonB-dependent receptor [Cyclobacteriaceae bacterium]
MRLKLLAVLLFYTSFAWAQQVVKGVVTDETGAPMPGVNILVKGTNKGTVTNVSGNYVLDGIKVNDVIQFSFIGYKKKETVFTGQESLNIQLELDAAQLEEIVVVGYGTSTSKELTGAVSSLKGSEVTDLNPTRLDQALQGQVAGVQITTNTGSPGGTSNIRIRGLSTYLDNNPLVIVDGIIYAVEGINALNPSDIESINVLKDASAAIYGVRGANGVIFITTKQGKRDSKPQFDFNGFVGTQETTRKLPLLNAREYAVIKNEAFAAGNQTPPFNNTNLGSGTNWQDEVFQTSPIQNWNLSVSGGSQKSNYSIGGSYLNQEGIVGGAKSSYKRYNLRINFTTDITDKVNLQSVFLYTNEQRKTLPENGLGSVLYNTVNASPNASVFTNGKYTFLNEVNDVINPLAQIENTHNNARVNKIAGKEEITYKINDMFQLAGRAGYTYALVDSKNFFPLVYYGLGKPQNTAADEDLNPRIAELFPGFEIPIESSVSEGRETFFDFNLEAFLNFSKTFNEKHNVKGTLGLSANGTDAEGLFGTAFNIPYNSVDFADISGVIDVNNLFNNTSSYQTQNRLVSQFLRGEYAYQSKYLASVVLRRDGSSRFGAQNRFGFFPSLSLGWVASEENFFNLSFINFLKLRMSYGIIGNDRIGDFTYRAQLNGEAVYPFNDLLTSGQAIGLYGNASLKWETTRQTNFGVDLVFLDDKLSVTAEYFVKKTNDLLFRPEVSALIGSYGAGSFPPFVNAGNVVNRGLELSINYAQQVTQDFKFNVGFNFATINNEVTALANGLDVVPGAPFGVGGAFATRLQVGLPIGAFYGYKVEGVYQSQEEIDGRGVTQADAKPGDLRFADVNGDGIINFSNDSDRTFLGSAIPEFTMGITLGASFKGFDFSALLYASIGNEIVRNYERQQPLANQLDYVINRWTGPNSTNEFPRLTTGANRNGVFSSYFVEDGSFARLRNVQLGYTLPTTLTKRIGVTRLRTYVACNNLFTITKYRGYDPDLGASSPLGAGVDYGFYPQARVWMAGINLNF